MSRVITEIYTPIVTLAKATNHKVFWRGKNGSGEIIKLVHFTTQSQSRQTKTLVGNKIADHSDVIGA